jgi:hypothetical protein
MGRAAWFKDSEGNTMCLAQDAPGSCSARASRDREQPAPHSVLNDRRQELVPASPFP